MITMKMMIDKTLSVLLAVLVLIMMGTASFGFTAFSEDVNVSDTQVFYIENAADLERLSKLCTLDSASEGMSVELCNNINLRNSSFEPIPIFSGIFDGKGFTVSGINYTVEGSHIGLFRYINKGATVKNLKAEGNLIPVGTKSYIGGIAGANSGTVTGCSFSGSIVGESYVGGIVGINDDSGLVTGCSTYGIICAQSYTGGVCGMNTGVIINCTNSMKVNTSDEEDSFSIEDIDLGKLVSNESFSGRTDMGGIAGFSNGTLQSCINVGEIGYAHMGYNVGGIVGRQSGFINGCINSGKVSGRKDVGGIAGQLEPFRSIQFSEDVAAKLSAEADKLKNAVDSAISHADNSSEKISSGIDALADNADSVREGISQVTDTLTEYADGISESANELSARIADTLEKSVPVLDELSDISTDITTLTKQLREVISNAADAGEHSQNALDDARKALDKIDGLSVTLENSLTSLSDGLKAVKNAIGDTERIRSAVGNIAESMKQLSESLSGIGNAVSDFADAARLLDSRITDSDEWNSLFSFASELGDSLTSMSSAITRISAAVTRLRDSVNDDEIKGIISDISTGMKDLQKATSDFEKAVNSISAAISTGDLEGLSGVSDAVANVGTNLRSGLKLFASAVGGLENVIDEDEAEKAINKLNSAVETLADALELMGKATSGITSILDGMRTSEAHAEIRELLSDASDGLITASDKASSALTLLGGAVDTVGGEIDLQSVKDALTFLSQATDGFAAVADMTDKAASDIRKSAESLSFAGDSAVLAVEGLGDAMDTLTGISEKITEVVDDIASIIGGLSDKAIIKLPTLGESFSGQTKGLSSSAARTLDSVKALNRELKDSASILLTDLQTVNDCISNLIHILADAVSGEDSVAENLSEITEDISDEDTLDATQGKVSGSKNSGYINGDVNSGGIAGSMAIEYDFDPEDDITNIGDTSLNFRYRTRAVIRDCKNMGEVESKKNYAGGIVGRMDLGSVISCNAEGTVSSTGGSYAGGIAGASYAIVRDCFARCRISAESYAGGITGYAHNLYDNNAISDFADVAEYCGAIAGGMSDDCKIERNGFVDRGVAGIDGVSYAGKAEAVSFDEMVKKPESPTDFAQFPIEFVADGKIITTLEKSYGDRIDDSEIPEIPQKEGYYSRWEEFEYDFISFPQVTEAVFTRYVTSISCEKDDGEALPIVIADGRFTDETVLHAESTVGEGGDDRIKVFLNGTSDVDGGLVYLRILLPKKSFYNPTLYSYGENSEKTKISYTVNGSYAVTSEKVNLTDGAVLAFEKGNSVSGIVAIIVISVLAVIALVIALVSAQRRKRLANGQKNH